jgi:peptidoglycan/xylan/chitin deacetylase (PgdA/CDA1 family)
MPNTRKSLILTYHRVTDEGAASGFYDVPVSLFRDHVARAAGRKSGMQIVFTFDDGTKDHLRAADILAEQGLKGVFFLDLGRLGQPGHILHDDVRRLDELGHTVGSHTISHRQLPTLSDADLKTELVESRRQLETLSGQRTEWFAPPGGHYDSRSLPAAREAGYRYVRTMDWGYAPDLESETVDQHLLPTVAVLRNMSTRRFDTILGGRAAFAGFALKQLARRVLPSVAYRRLRDWTAGSNPAS